MTRGRWILTALWLVIVVAGATALGTALGHSRDVWMVLVAVPLFVAVIVVPVGVASYRWQRREQERWRARHGSRRR